MKLLPQFSIVNPQNNEFLKKGLLYGNPFYKKKIVKYSSYKTHI